MTLMKNRATVQGGALLRRKVLFYICACTIGCVIGPLSECIFPLWMAMKPLPSTVEAALVDTPFRGLSQWVMYFLLYVPELLLFCFTGCFAGFWMRKIPWVWISMCVICYASASVLRGAGPWWYVFADVPVGSLRNGLYWDCMLFVLTGTPYVGAWATSRLRSPAKRPGECERCDYSLFGLTSGVCPECGMPFAGREQNRIESSKNASERPGPRCDQYSLLSRLFVAALLLLWCYRFEWTAVRTLLRDTVMAVLRQVGHNPFALTYEGAPALMVRETMCYYTRSCLYLDLVAIVIPFAWIPSSPFGRNVLRTLGMVCLIEVGNIVRGVFAIHYDALGVDWMLSHDVPNCLIWCAAIGMTFVAATRHMNVSRRDSECRVNQIGGDGLVLCSRATS